MTKCRFRNRNYLLPHSHSTGQAIFSLFPLPFMPALFMPALFMPTLFMPTLFMPTLFLSDSGIDYGNNTNLFQVVNHDVVVDVDSYLPLYSPLGSGGTRKEQARFGPALLILKKAGLNVCGALAQLCAVSSRFVYRFGRKKGV